VCCGPGGTGVGRGSQCAPASDPLAEPGGMDHSEGGGEVGESSEEKRREEERGNSRPLESGLGEGLIDMIAPCFLPSHPPVCVLFGGAGAAACREAVRDSGGG
jgi:hypothetical protein